MERLVRRGVYTGPLNLTWVSIGGGFDGPNPYTMMEFIRRVPDGASLTLESIMRNVLPINTMAIALGLHPRCGNEDTLWGQLGEKCTSADAVRQLVRIAGELGREVATGKEARDIYKLDEYWGSADEALAKLGYPPNRQPGQRGFLPPRLISTPDRPSSRTRLGPQVRARFPRARTCATMSTANHAFEVDPLGPPVTGRAPDIDIESRNGASSWHRWSPRAGSTTPSSTRPPRPPRRRPVGSSRGSSSPSPSHCSCRTTCPGRSCPPSSPSSSWNGR